MVRSRHNLFLVKKAIVILLLSISCPSMSVAQESSLAYQAIELSIFSRYTQILIKSYDFYFDKLGFNETTKTSGIQNFPVL